MDLASWVRLSHPPALSSPCSQTLPVSLVISFVSFLLFPQWLVISNYIGIGCWTQDYILPLSQGRGLFFNLHQAVKCLHLCPGAPGLLSPWHLKALAHGRSESGWSFMPYLQGSHPFLPPGTMEGAFSSLLPFFQSSLTTQRRSMEKTLRVDANSSFICGSQCFILSDCSH